MSSSTYGFTPQMPGTVKPVGSGPGRSQEPEAPSGRPTWVAGTQGYEPSLLPPRELHEQEAAGRSEVPNTGHEHPRKRLHCRAKCLPWAFPVTSRAYMRGLAHTESL